MKQISKGFTLVELLITMVIIGIITAIAVPSYDSYTKKARRNDAKAALSSITNALERYHTANNTFVGATLGTGGIYASQTPLDGSTKYYNLSIRNAAVNSYTVVAIPMGAQTADGMLSYTSTGVKDWYENDSGTGTPKPW